jgi:glycosyltransferase involved in cell wall biosynthesis
MVVVVRSPIDRAIVWGGKRTGERVGAVPSLLIATTHHWGSALQVGAHHIARHYARSGWRVGMISAPLTPPHLLKLSAPDVAERFTAWRSRGEHDGVVDLPPFTVLPVIGPGLRSTRLMRAWPRWTMPAMVRELHRFDLMRPDLLMADSPLHVSLIEMLNPGALVYRIPDYTPGFAGLPRSFERLEKEMVSRAALVVCAAPELRDYADQLGAARTVVVENGVDVDLMGRPLPPPPEYLNIPRPRAVYVGALREWFDYRLVRELSEAIPEMQFVIIGPTRKAALSPSPNVHLLGERRREKVPAYLQHADVGIIPFDRKNHAALVDGVNPLKLYEYCAAGLPVVATRWPLLERVGSPALLADDPAGFVTALRRARDDADLGETGRCFARSHSWDERLAPLDDALVDLVKETR